MFKINSYNKTIFWILSKKGPVAFQDLYGVFYPAISLNRGVSVTLHTTLDAPLDAEGSWRDFIGWMWNYLIIERKKNFF